MSKIVEYTKASFRVMTNLITGDAIKRKHTDKYLEIRDEILNLKTPSKNTYKSNLSNNRQQAATYLRKAYEKKVNG